jgi:branched-subunit amino acid aminotransferase/4-amino-4-deoxychorismate lyase
LPEPLRLSISKNPLHQGVQEMRYKVSARDFYDSERTRIRRETGADEVLFVNPEGVLCEGSFTSLFVRHDDHLWTPDISAGLLPGILRDSLLQSGEAEEAVLRPKDLIGEVIYVGNSLRGLMRAKLISPIPV